jgi:iron complex transport system ATP-binding protein
MTTLSCHHVDVVIARTRVALDLDLVVEPGQFWGLMGANGIGKTTLMRCLAGLSAPEAGHVALDGEPIRQMPRRLVARRLGMLQQHTAYVFDASVLETALTGRHPHLGPWRKETAADVEKARRAIKRMDLGKLEQRSVTGLSGGEARRLAFAALMVQEPEIMLLDEPSNHLDLRHQVSIMSRIGDEVYGNGRLAVAAMHDVNLAATFCSHVLMLFGAGQWEAGGAMEMLTVERLERMYQCPVESVDTPAGRRFHPAFDKASA